MQMRKQTFGESIIEGLEELAEALVNQEPLTDRFRCTWVTLTLPPPADDSALDKDGSKSGTTKRDNPC